MNWKFTLILLAIAAVFYGYFALYENKQPGTRELGQNAGQVFAYDRNQVDGLTITDHDTKIELQRGEGNHWKMVAPVTDRADGGLIEQVFSDLETMHKVDTIPARDVSKTKLADYGLQAPREKLSVIAHGGHTTELIFGNQTAIEGKDYLQLTGSGDVLVVNDDLRKLLQKDVNAWRDHRLTNLLATDVNKVVVKNPAGEIELQRVADNWKLVKPLAARADDARVNDLISQLVTLDIKSFVADDKADAAAYGLTDPRSTVTLYTAANPKGVEVMIGNGAADPAKGTASPAPTATPDPKLAETVYVRMPSRQSIYAVPNTVGAFVGLRPDELRDQHLVRVNPDAVDRITITPADGAAFTVGRKDQTWTVLDGTNANQPVDAATASRLLQNLAKATVLDFVTDSASDLAKYGLDKPSLKVALSSFASENRAESNAGEKLITAVAFGKLEGTNVYAKVEDEPFIVSVPQVLVAEVPTSPLQLQSTGIFQVDPEKVTSLEVKANGRPDLALTRPDKGSWTLANKALGELDVAKTQALVATLARLRAVRWIGPMRPEYGLDQPVETLAFSTTDNPKVNGRLMVGKTGPEGLHYAQAEGKQGVFVIAPADYESLTQPLVPLPAAPAAPTAPIQPAPAASPAPSPTAAPAPAPAATPTPPVAPVPSVAVPSTPAPTATAISAVAATPTPASTPEPTMTPTPSPASTPTAEPTAAPTPEMTPTPSPTGTVSAAPTASPAASSAPTPGQAEAVATPASSPSPTPVATPADVPVPTASPIE